MVQPTPLLGSLADKAAWRLSLGRGIPVKCKLLSIDADYETTKSGAKAVFAIAIEDKDKFLDVVLPPPKEYGDIYVPQHFILAGMAVTKAEIKSFNTDIPADAYGIDQIDTSLDSYAEEEPPAGTYYKTLYVSLTLTQPIYGDIDTDKPETWLDIKAESSGNFIHTPPIGVTTHELDGDSNPVAGAGEKIRHPLVPYTVLCPQTTWSVRWASIPYDNYKEIIVPRLRQAEGHVNSELFPPLHDAVKGTLILLSYEYEFAYSWRTTPTSALLGRPAFVDLTFKVLEKRVEWEGKIHGHQSFWIPGVGWRYVEFAGRPTFETYDFNDLFSRDLIPPSPT